MGLMSSLHKNYNPLNGYFLCKRYIPEEILILILSKADPKDLLACSRVCKNWNHLIKSNVIWVKKFNRKFKNQNLKEISWQAYYALFTGRIFDVNLLLNGNGQDGLKHWKPFFKGAPMFEVETMPAPVLPRDVDDFRGCSSCFSALMISYPVQHIHLSRTTQYILNHCRPHILVSEWLCEEFFERCNCIIRVKLHYVDDKRRKQVMEEVVVHTSYEHWPLWTKFESVIKIYPKNVFQIDFEHGVVNTKLAGGVVKLLFDTIEK